MNSSQFNIVSIMVSMIKSYATKENYSKLVFTITPNYYALYQAENIKSYLGTKASGNDYKESTMFRGIPIKVLEGDPMLTLSCK